MKYARIVDAVAVEIFVPPDGVAIDECFHPDLAKAFKEVPEDTAVNAVWDGKKWVNPIIEEQL